MSLPSSNSMISPPPTHLDDISILFLGKELFLSNQTLRSVQSEFGIAAHRCENLDHAAADSGGSFPALRLLIVDQMMLEDLLHHPEQYIEASGSGCLAFAYRKEEAARSLFARWNRRQYGDIGFLPMNVTPDVWRSILRLLLHYELYLPSVFVDSLEMVTAPDPNRKPSADAPKRPCGTLYDQLTRREKEVLRLVSQGDSNKAVALRLGITEHTVKLHMHNVVSKIGVSNRTAAASFFFEVAPEEARRQSVE